MQFLQQLQRWVLQRNELCLSLDTVESFLTHKNPWLLLGQLNQDFGWYTLRRLQALTLLHLFR